MYEATIANLHRIKVKLNICRRKLEAFIFLFFSLFLFLFCSIIFRFSFLFHCIFCSFSFFSFRFVSFRFSQFGQLLMVVHSNVFTVLIWIELAVNLSFYIGYKLASYLYSIICEYWEKIFRFIGKSGPETNEKEREKKEKEKRKRNMGNEKSGTAKWISVLHIVLIFQEATSESFASPSSSFSFFASSHFGLWLFCLENYRRPNVEFSNLLRLFCISMQAHNSA